MTVVVTVDGTLVVAPPPSGVSDSPLAPGMHASQRTFALFSSTATTHGPLSIAAVHTGGAVSSPGSVVSVPPSAGCAPSSLDELQASAPSIVATARPQRTCASRRDIAVNVPETPA